ncbi:MAG: L,D-transpeptidase, partial [Nitrospirota bacterium]
MNHNRNKALNQFVKVVLLLWLSLIIGCKTAPEPPEVKHAETQEHNLWRAGASIYTPEEYTTYKTALRKGKEHLINENSRFAWFRNYDSIAIEFRSIIKQGELVQQKIQQQKELKTKSISFQISYLKNRLETLKKLSVLINEGHMARKDITRAELILKEAEGIFNKERFTDAEEKLKYLSPYMNSAIEAIFPILNRYVDGNQIKKWRSWVNETVSQSKEQQSYAIVVSKIDRLLILYKSGKPYKSYSAGVGINGTKDKLHQGDRATPEGKYRITKKLSRSRYHKALLINYPNEDDRAQFAVSKKKGLVPRGIGIGGLIEIHGGGSSSMTYGCVALENREIDDLFSLADVGTPVTIVGALDYENNISLIM